MVRYKEHNFLVRDLHYIVVYIDAEIFMRSKDDSVKHYLEI